jgi:xylan 1,4-beta-xylosidase
MQRLENFSEGQKKHCVLNFVIVLNLFQRLNPICNSKAMKWTLTAVFLLSAFQLAFSQQPTVSIQVDASKSVGEMTPFWSFFGYDEPNYTTSKDGQKLLSELKQLSPTPVYIRTHNLLTSRGNSQGPDLKWGFTDAYKEDMKGNPIYNWTIVDSIVDAYIQRGMKPLMEIGFMPKDLSSKPEPYEHTWSAGGNLWTGWTYPPKDYAKWRELVYQWVKHSVERYGKEEVTTWLWEVWNEPDIAYWSGTFEEYCKLYDYAVDGLKRACPECVIGGPHTTSPRSDKAYTYLTKFIEHCLRGKNYATGKTGTPLQYIGFHAKGAPEFVDGHIRMNMGAQLKDIQRAFEAVNSFPELKDIPIIIGECDPEGCAACSEKRDPKYGYRNGTMYSSYTAASFARIYELMDQYKVNLKGVVSWSFEFEDQEWFAGFRDLATHGVDKPVLNVFRMFGIMDGQRISVQSENGLKAADIIASGVRGRNDIYGIASKNENSVSIMVWNYHDDNIAGAASSVELTVSGIESDKVLLHHYRVDDQFSNSFVKWKALGSPQQVTAEQYEELENAGQLQLYTSPEWIQPNKRLVNLKFDLPRQGVSLIQLTW